MTTEVDQEEVTTQEDESAFEAGFAEARGDESPAEPTPVEPTEPEAQQVGHIGKRFSECQPGNGRTDHFEPQNLQRILDRVDMRG